MKVQDLINILNKVEDKDQIILFRNWFDTPNLTL